jgi:pilus assembly protein Flp/PilA
MAALARFAADESGAAAVKYGLVAACLALAIVTVLHGVGGKVRDTLASSE